VAGHEFVGVVEDAPPGDVRWIGQRVVADINVGCGACAWCARGVKEHCPTRTVVGIRGRDGAFAERLSLPAGNLHALPAAIGDASAVFIEPVAAACRILEQLPIPPDARIAVLGDGRLGLVTAQVLRTAARDVTLFGRHDDKLTVARALGITVAAEATSTSSYDIVVEATGKPSGLTRALDLVRPRGTIVLKSTFHGEAGAALWPVAVHEVTIVGSRCGPFDRAIALVASGAVQVEPLIARVFALEAFTAAFDAARRELKVLLQCAPKLTPPKQ
jgi:alcohol dehydrogenase